jgi:hypothetical protein
MCSTNLRCQPPCGQRTIFKGTFATQRPSHCATNLYLRGASAANAKLPSGPVSKTATDRCSSSVKSPRQAPDIRSAAAAERWPILKDCGRRVARSRLRCGSDRWECIF